MIYHITTRGEWEAAYAAGAYRAPSLMNEGFIHCSKSAQIVDVANAFYRSVPDLVLLCINPDALTPEVKWEAPAHPEAHQGSSQIDGSSLFPHVYGAIDLEAVEQVVNFSPGPDGFFVLPEDLPE